MLTARQVSQGRFVALGGMSRRVLGYGASDYAALRALRIERFREALAALRAAQQVPPILAREWSDADLEAAAERVEAQLEVELGEQDVALASARTSTQWTAPGSAVGPLASDAGPPT